MNPSKLSKAQQLVNKYFPKGVVAYQPGLTLVFKSLPIGIVLSQLLYWQGKGANKDGWVYKTIEEMKTETGLTRHQQDRAIKKLVELGIIETKLASIPAKRHFLLRLDRLLNLLPALKNSAGVVYLNPPRQLAEKWQSTTEITHKTTPKNTHTSFKNFRNRPSPIAATIKQRAESLKLLRIDEGEEK